MARPTTDEVALRNWNSVPNTLKAKVPVLVEKAMKRMEGILDNDKAADSAVLRAAEGVIKLYKDMKDSEDATTKQDAEGAENATGVAAAVAENKPMISLVAFDPSKKTG